MFGGILIRMMKSIHRRLHWPTMMLILLFAVDAATAVGLPGGSPADGGYTKTDVILLVSYILQALARQQWAKRARALGLEVNVNGQIPEGYAGRPSKNK